MPSHLLPVDSPTVPPQSRTECTEPVERTERTQPLPFAGIRLVHAALRRDLARLPNALRLLPHSDEAGAQALQRHWDFVTAMLTCHHEQQDSRMWPMLRRFVPELRLLLNWLEADHHNLDHSFTRVTTLVRIATRDPASAWSVGYAVEELAARLETHLRIEERQLLPRLIGVFPAGSRIGTLPELLDLLRAAQGPGSADALAWLLEGLHPTLIDALLADCDDELVRHWPHWRDTYARCSDELWGPSQV